MEDLPEGERMTYIDPPPAPEPGEAGGLRAKDLKNRVVILRATGTGEDDSVRDKNDRPWRWTETDVWVIDRSGIELHETGLRVSWWRVQDQLKQAGESFVAGRVTEQEDRSIILAPVTGAAREVLAAVMPQVIATTQATTAAQDEPPVGEEPF